MPNKEIKVKEIMLNLKEIPIVTEKQYLKDALVTMTKFSVGIVCIVDEHMKLNGVMTDGDIRRMVLNDQKPLASLFLDDVIDHSRQDFAFINENEPLKKAIDIINTKKIWDLPVMNEEGFLKGLLHLHPIVNYCLDKA
tara:strand:+ start:380 stop:793 length:414 start_codon:yes stop_codon:yes gene_type:complete